MNRTMTNIKEPTSPMDLFNRDPFKSKCLKKTKGPENTKDVLPKRNQTEAALWFCGVCHKTSTRLESHTLHMKLHARERALECNICYKKLDNLELYRQHAETHRGKQWYSFKTTDLKHPNQVKNSQPSTVDEYSPYDCNVCQMKFDVLDDCIEHVRKHFFKQRFDCVVCGKCFGSERNFKLHIRIHTDHRPYKCYVCCKTFRYKTEMIQHACLTNWIALGHAEGSNGNL